ncbi:lysM domain receptor-like kinase 4 [Macadamia integrifolia]|uniref:lysM domain receptor-like kinase 4 n=1 Tax=Macadamia integrifolia TaxID=60698 RepID=UPI001C4F6392|nr:lysM domain receptor-like kinase 4 [Macadamia integrifolia]
MGVPQSLILLCIISLISSSVTLAQQPYVGLGTTACGTTDNSNSVLGYYCNGLNPSCQSYLIFRSQPPYYTVPSIAALFGSDLSQLAQVNSVSQTWSFQTNQEVIVPVNCSCSGQYSQANTSYIVKPNDTPFIIANDTFQGLSTCQAIQIQNNISATGLNIGQTITIPLRCACPTKNQSVAGIKYLFSYTTTTGDSVYTISSQFGANYTETLAANELPNIIIYQFTTLLVPLRYPPSSSQILSPPSPPPSSTPFSPSQSSTASIQIWVYVVIAVAASIGLMLVIFIIALHLLFRKRKRSEANPILVSKSTNYDSILSSDPLNKKSEVESREYLFGIADSVQSIKVYKFEELKSATENFSPSCWIKGSVYRGKINGDIAAIKKINGDVSEEINLLSKINHVNIIRLSGVCFSEGDWYFVYEYAMNGPLSDWIHGNMSRPKILSWTERVQIALDVAMGLDYLHSYTTPPYVHKDVKSSNILLGNDFRAKVANFGLARSAGGQEGDFALTKHIVGTKGYMAPEYLADGLISPRLDVYAFGVVMLELISGKKVIVSSQGEDLLLINVLIAILHKENAEEKLGGFIDPSLEASYPLDLALSLARLTESCLRKDPASRPGMDTIVQSLSIIVTTSLTWESSFLGNRGSNSYMY